MYLNKIQTGKIQQIINKVYTENLNEDFILSILPILSDALNIQYFGSYLLPNRFSRKKLLISNNPSDYLDVYMPLMEQDFLLDHLIETNTITVYRQLVQNNYHMNKVFIEETQKIRPASDCCYIPLHINNSFAGFFGLAREGLRNNPFSKNDIEIFNFISGFLTEGFRRTLYLNTDNEDTAYLNSFGKVVHAGDRIQSAFKDLFGEQFMKDPLNSPSFQAKAFSTHFKKFLRVLIKPGSGDLWVSALRRQFHFIFKMIPNPHFRTYLPNEPQVKVELMKEDDPLESSNLLDFTKLDIKYQFTQREKEIILKIYQGWSNMDISIALKISESTVKRHIWNIFNKTGADNRTQLVFQLNN